MKYTTRTFFSLFRYYDHHSQYCTRNSTPIQFRIASDMCVQGSCGKYGRCYQFFSGGNMFSTCTCFAGTYLFFSSRMFKIPDTNMTYECYFYRLQRLGMHRRDWSRFRDWFIGSHSPIVSEQFALLARHRPRYLSRLLHRIIRLLCQHAGLNGKIASKSKSPN